MAAERAFGDAFGAGFLPFLDSGALADVTVALPGGGTFRLHSLLLAYHSAFFHRAFASEFVEGKDKRMHLELEPHLLPFFPDLLRASALLRDSVAAMVLLRVLRVASAGGFCRGRAPDARPEQGTSTAIRPRWSSTTYLASWRWLGSCWWQSWKPSAGVT